MMAESIAVLEPGIRQMRGLIHFYVGEDEAVKLAHQCQRVAHIGGCEAAGYISADA